MPVAIRYKDTGGEITGVAIRDTAANATAALTAVTDETIVALTAGQFTAGEPPEADGEWERLSSGNVQKKPVPVLSELDKLIDDAYDLHGWLERQSIDIERFGHYYTDDTRKALHDGEAQAHRGAHVVLLRTAPSTEFLTVAQRREWIKYAKKGFKDAATVQAAYPRAVLAGVARAQAGLTPIVRIPSSPLTWVDPRTDPPEQVNLADVIDFSGSAGYTKSDGTVVTGLGFTTLQTDLTADYSTCDWRHTITGDKPNKPTNVQATAPAIPQGSTTTDVTVTWTLPVAAPDTADAVTEIQAEHHDDDAATDFAHVKLGATQTSHAFSGVEAGTHVFRVRGVNANGNGPWVETTIIVP